jgi:hypothetical protein
MNAIVRSASMSVAGALLLGASMALSSATVVSGANRIHPDRKNSSITCNKSFANCFTVQNTNELGSAILGEGGGSAIIGESSSNAGVLGSSTSNAGVNGGSSSGYGVFGVGLTSSSYGVYGETPYGGYPAVYGVSTDGNGGYFRNDSGGSGEDYYSLYAENDAGTGGFPFGAQAWSGSSLTGYFEVDGGGDGDFSGSVTAAGGYKTEIRSRGGETLAASAAMTAQATMEDTGTARLSEGEAAVRFDPAFANTIDANHGYQVFLTPNGDTRGLYVSAKYEGGFIVRENERGRSSVYFDYRIVAHPHGVSDVRLPHVDAKIPARPNLRRSQPHVDAKLFRR